MTVLFQVFGHVFRHQDVTGIATIHHPLRDVDSGARYVGATTHVNHTTDWPAMNSYPQFQFRVFACSAADLQRTFHRRFRSIVENQRHPVTCRNSDETAFCLGSAEVFALAHDLIEQLEQSPLLRSHQLRVADNVDKEHIGNLQLDLFLNFGRHLVNYFGACSAASFWKRGSFRSGSNIGSSRSSAGVSGMPTASEPPLGIESSF